MKFVIIMSAVLGLVFGKPSISYYVTGNDYLEIDAITAHVPSLKAYVDCFLDKTPCSSLAQSFKDVLQDSVIRACDRCNVAQKQQYGRFLLALKLKLPLDYLCFRQKYDPQNIYFDKLEAELSKFWHFTKRAQRPKV